MGERPIHFDSCKSLDALSQMQQAAQHAQDPLSSKVAHISDPLIKDLFSSSTAPPKEPISEHLIAPQNATDQQAAIAQQFFHGAPQRQMVQEMFKADLRMAQSLESQKVKKGLLFVEEVAFDDSKQEQHADTRDPEEEDEDASS